MRRIALAKRPVAARIAVDLDAAEEDEAADAGARSRFGEMTGGGAIDLHERCGIGLGVADMDTSGEMDDLVDVAQRRRPIRLRPDLADDADFRSRRRRGSGGATLRQEEAVMRPQHREKGAAD